MQRVFFKQSERQKNNPLVPRAKIIIKANNISAQSLVGKAEKTDSLELSCCKAL